MREIKFRGKRIDNGEWVFGGISIKAHGTFIHDEDLPFDDVCEVIPESVGQFTGLRDSKRTEEYPEGQEIYEGDICKFEILKLGNQPLEGQTMIIEMRNGAWGFIPTHPELVHEDDRGWCSFWRGEDKELWCLEYFTVIGNIPEHPHLLEGDH